MKLFLAVLLLSAGVLAELSPNYEPIGFNYHENYGIPTAAAIKKAEEDVEIEATRIVGGAAASLGQYPYQAGLLITLAHGATSVCGASLITNTRLTTAAHCWFDGRQNARQLTVVLGSTTLFFGGTRIATSNVQIHPNYNSSNLNNDIGIIITQWVSYNDIIQPIVLASGAATYVGMNAVASGFGMTSDSGFITTNQFISHVTVPVITNTVCAETYGPSVVADSVLCTSSAGGRGTCQGDSGGPLVVTLNGQRTLVGVSSFVAEIGCQAGLPAGFARVASFHSWISARL